MYFFDIIVAPRVRTGSKNWYKLTDFMAFGNFLYKSIPPKVEMNTFSDGISLCRLLIDSELLHVLL